MGPRGRGRSDRSLELSLSQRLQPDRGCRLLRDTGCRLNEKGFEMWRFKNGLVSSKYFVCIISVF